MYLSFSSNKNVCIPPGVESLEPTYVETSKTGISSVQRLKALRHQTINEGLNDRRVGGRAGGRSLFWSVWPCDGLHKDVDRSAH